MKAPELIYAINPDGQLVYIEDVENGAACKCTCPECHQPLEAKNGGKYRRHHFAHASGHSCEGYFETMLHLLAKKKVQEAFLSGTPIKAIYDREHSCRKRESCFFSNYQCSDYKDFTFILNDFYDSCEQEVPYHSGVGTSDLMFFSKTHPERPPIYIEFFVTHASEESKLKCGERIIETKLESIEDIDHIIEYGFKENKYSDVTTGEHLSLQTTFHGFDRTIIPEEKVANVNLHHFLYFASGKWWTNDTASRCDNIQPSLQSTVLLEILFRYHSYVRIPAPQWIGYRKYGIRNCRLCKNFIKREHSTGMICRYHKILHIAFRDEIDTTQAQECKYFSLDEESMNYHLRLFDSLQPDSHKILKQADKH